MYRILLLLLLVNFSYAQNRVILDKNHELSIYVPDATTRIMPGDTVILTGRYNTIKIYNIQGTAEKPIIFINKGLVTIEGTQKDVAAFSGRYYKILGNGDKNQSYGIKFTARKGIGYYGLRLLNSSDVEVAFCEIYNVSNGILQNPVKGTPMNRCYYHDNFFHDILNMTKGKTASAFYLGNMQPQDSTGCVFKNCIIENNLMRNVTGNGIQLYNGDFTVQKNNVINCHPSPDAGRTAAIMFGLYATGSATENKVDSSSGYSLSVIGYGNISIKGNKFAHISSKEIPNQDIVFINSNSPKNLGKLRVVFENNEIQGEASRYAVFNGTPATQTEGSIFRNNVITGSFLKKYSLTSKDLLK